jgi:hypothetical protein
MSEPMPAAPDHPMNDLRYPVGKFAWPETLSRDELDAAIAEIAALPAQLRAAVKGLSPEQLDTPYRDGGWTVRQVAHHVPDSHLNSYVRFKLALTEDEPVIKPYDEAAWARLADSMAAIEPSLKLLEALHDRWVTLMRGMSNAEWQRRFTHPERGPMRLDITAALYAWHSRHHLAHVMGLRSRRSW